MRHCDGLIRGEGSAVGRNGILGPTTQGAQPPQLKDPYAGPLAHDCYRVANREIMHDPGDLRDDSCLLKIDLLLTELIKGLPKPATLHA